ncbi:MAG: hypothetical protein CMH63_00695 [Nanoarchaeota archaeon]|nr:hypothetical protein [Nanoarchaeota archaeon]|tara:strand:+ start:23427 stop:23828 length:402 start_codon:yes stop_codon:yes gene_type:complete
MPKEKLLHARIQNPLLIRKSLLESAITSAEILKIGKDLGKIKTEKNKKKTAIKKIINEVKELSLQLEEHELPPLNVVSKEKIKKAVPKRKLVKEEKSRRKKQERILKIESKEDQELSGIDLEISNLKDKIRKL